MNYDSLCAQRYAFSVSECNRSDGHIVGYFSKWNDLYSRVFGHHQNIFMSLGSIDDQRRQLQCLEDPLMVGLPAMKLINRQPIHIQVHLREHRKGLKDNHHGRRLHVASMTGNGFIMLHQLRPHLTLN